VISASSLLNFVMASFTQPLRITRRGQHRVENTDTGDETSGGCGELKKSEEFRKAKRPGR
ncbi:unnamed protein product, partial [Cladocopium goreaui]